MRCLLGSVTVAVLIVARGWSYDLDTITVTGTRTEKRLADTPVVTEVISADELEEEGATDLTDALAAYGVILDGDRSHNDAITLQGMSGERVLILIDGRRVAGRLAGNIDGRSISMANVERIEIVRGPQSALYGSDAMGGVINIITKAPAPRLSFQVENTGYPAYDDITNETKPSDVGAVPFQTQKATFDGGARFGDVDGSLTLSGSRSQFYYEELQETSVLPQGWSGQGNTQWQGSLAGGTWDLVGNGTVLREEDQTSFTGSLDRRDLARGELSAGWSGTVGDGSLRFRLGNQQYQRTTQSYTGSSSTWSDPSTTTQNSSSAEAWYSTSWGDNWLLTFGTDAAVNFVWDPDLSQSQVSSDQEAVVAQAEWFEEGSHSVVTGLRLERDSRYGFFLAPKISAMKTLGPGWRLLSGLGVGYRAPTMEELYYDIDWSWHPIVLGNSNLQPETSLAANLGLEWAISKGPSARVNAYHQELFNEIAYVEQGTASDGRVIYKNENRDRTVRSGVDVEASVPLGPWALSSTWGYVYGWDRANAVELTDVTGQTASGALRFAWASFSARLSVRFVSLTGLTTLDATVNQDWGDHFSTRILVSNMTSQIDAEYGPYAPIGVTVSAKAQL